MKLHTCTMRACMTCTMRACMLAYLLLRTYVRTYKQTNEGTMERMNKHTQTFYNTCDGLHVECTTRVVLFRLKSSTQRHARRYTSTYMHLWYAYIIIYIYTLIHTITCSVLYLIVYVHISYIYIFIHVCIYCCLFFPSCDLADDWGSFLSPFEFNLCDSYRAPWNHFRIRIVAWSCFDFKIF